MVTLPENQDRLLKELHELEEQEKAGIWPERSKIIFILLIVTAALFIIIITFLILRKYYLSIPLQSTLVLIAFGGLVGGYFNKKWGIYISIIMSTLGAFYATYVTTAHYSELITLLDALAIFVASTGFGRKGFVPVFVIITIKALIVLILFPGARYTDLAAYLVDISAHLIIISLVGYVPILIQSTSIASRRARKQEIRAEILSLQNRDLLQSWETFYKEGKK